MQTTPDRKTIYFIRHGQSEGNILKHFQDGNDPLSALGRKQARLVAERAKRLNGEVILSSPMNRALETAKAIQEATGLVLEEHFNLRELLVPSSLHNKPIHSPQGDAFNVEFFKNNNNPEWRYDDEENYLELHTRALAVLRHLENRIEKVLFVVTHGAFMSSIMTAMLLEGEMNKSVTTSLFRFLRKKNTGITRCEYFKNNGDRMNWRLTTWNDHAHLVGVETDK